MNTDENGLSRRKFLSNILLAGSFLPLFPWIPARRPGIAQSQELEIHIFSKHLQFLGYEEMAGVAADLGFHGVDLTVRPAGHVAPEDVEKDLPSATEAIKKAGLQLKMITTEVDDASDPVDQKVLSAAAGQNISYYRMNWFEYPNDKSIPGSIEYVRNRIKALSLLNEKLGIVGCYQNHAGKLMGASLWELFDMVDGADPEYMGVQYDIRHATVEGGYSWENGLKLIRPFLKTIVIKDVKWIQQDGNWTLQNTPIGEGMINFARYFQLLKKYGINVPVSLHLEYPIGGAEHGARQLNNGRDVVFDAMKRDLENLKRLWEQA